MRYTYNDENRDEMIRHPERFTDEKSSHDEILFYLDRIEDEELKEDLKSFYYNKYHPHNQGRWCECRECESALEMALGN